MGETLTDESLRPLMFAIAYRMLGSVADAEDVVQEASLRLHQRAAGGLEIDSPSAYAATVTTRLAVDHLRSARVRREHYVGTWLPEPLLTGPGGPAGPEGDPAVHAERDESVSMAVLVVLESLSPVERAVFVLREAFEYDYGEIARIVGKTEANCRQIAARARRRVRDGVPRSASSPERAAELAETFLAAAQRGDMAALERVLADDAVFYGDGGGKAFAVKQPVRGRVQVARFLLGLGRQGARQRLRVEPAEVNGQPGALVFDPAGRIISVLSVEIADGRVAAVRGVVNPDKLRHLTGDRHGGGQAGAGL